MESSEIPIELVIVGGVTLSLFCATALVLASIAG